MKKILWIILCIVSVSLICTAEADTVYDLKNGFTITLPEGWQTDSRTWTNGNVGMTLLTFSLPPEYFDLPSEDLHSFCVKVAEGMDYNVNSFQSYDPLNGFFVAIMDVTVTGMNIDSKLAMIISPNSMCVMDYAFDDPSIPVQEDDLIDMIYLMSYSEPSELTAMETSGNRKVDEGIFLEKVPLLVRMNEEDYNMVYLGMPKDSVSVLRSGHDFEMIKTILAAGETTDMIIWRVGEDGLILNKSPHVKIRIKDQRFEGREDFDLRFLRKDLRKSLLWDAVIPTMTVDGKYETETVNDIPYARFEFTAQKIHYEIRYMTAIRGDLIYVMLSSADPITESDETLLRTVLESIFVAE